MGETPLDGDFPEMINPVTINPQFIQRLAPYFSSSLRNVDLSLWETLGAALESKLSELEPQELPRELKDDPLRQKRIHYFYLPILFWVKERLEQFSGQKPMIIGINAPQGSGKTTLTTLLCEVLPILGLTGVPLSIDDFYLPRESQEKLARQYPFNELLQQRGYPGTHDIGLGIKTLSALKNSTQKKIILPTYDKSKFKGKGDRLPISEWKTVERPLDLVFFEGWMLGFQSVATTSLPNESFVQINHLLEQYKKWDEFLDAFVFLQPENPQSIVEWRVEAEEKMKAKGLPGMTKSAVTVYIQKFIPAYDIYLPKLSQSLPVPIHLTLTLGHNRLPVYDFSY